MAYVMGGQVIDYDNYEDSDREGSNIALSSMEQYDATSGRWSRAAAMSIVRHSFGACMVAGQLYVTGGTDGEYRLSNVEKYTPSSDT
jgi:hypothetical protein